MSAIAGGTGNGREVITRERLADSPDKARSVLAYLEDAGTQPGSLRIACGAAARSPLYARALEPPGRGQRLITQTYELDR